MRIVFVGAERVGLACLRKLLELKMDVVGVFTADETLKSKIADYVPFDSIATALPSPLVKVTDSDAPDFIQQIRECRPDLILVASWSQKIPEEIVQLPPLGCIGIHYSLLPERRGGAPLFWAIADGLTESGISLFYLNGGIDAGDIIAQKKFSIGPEETAGMLLDKIKKLAPALLAEQIEAIRQGTAPRKPQDKNLASVTKARRPEQSRIPDGISLEEMDRFIRALAPPYPVAFTEVGGRKLLLTSSRWKDGRLWVEGHFE